MPLLNANSSEYKKARRRFYNSTKHRPHDFDAEWTPFRAAEKRYKTRFPPPDLSLALDFATLNVERDQEILQGVWRGSPDAIEYEELPIESADGRRAYIIPRIPGLVVMPSFVNVDKQRELIRWALSQHARHPNPTNLDVHYVLPEEGLWNAYLASRLDRSKEKIVQPKVAADQPSDYHVQPPGPRQLVNNIPVTPETFDDINGTLKQPPAPSPSATPTSVSSLIPKLRWANIGWFYHWGTKQYDFTQPQGPIDNALKDLCKDAVKLIDWDRIFEGTEAEWEEAGLEWKTWVETYEPDAGIVNFYQNKDTLMAHVDRSEVCATSPLVSVSLGNAAVFLIGGKTRDTEPVSLILRSGDVVIMSGPGCRRAYHGVPRILEGTLPSHLCTNNHINPEWEIYEEYMKTTRINVNVRQVFPKGFNPGIA